MSKNQRVIHPVLLMAVAAGILLITMGIRQCLGLFVLPIVSDTTLSIVSVSFALAVGQFVWGLAQPVFGAIADQHGANRVIIVGAVLLALGLALTPWISSPTGLVLTLGILMAAGAAAGSFSILIGLTAKYLPAQKRSMATGIINAGGSAGQLVYAPLAQLLISGPGWRMGMLVLLASALLTIPLTLLSHQIGGFLGAWLGGVAMAQLGSYDWIWYADIALALGAALINLPIREAKVLPQTALA